MREAIFGLIGVFVGSAITIFVTLIQVFNENKARILERKIRTFQFSIDSACQFLHSMEQDKVRHDRELDDWADRNREARLNHFKAVGYLRLEGCVHAADELVNWYNYVSDKGREYVNTSEGWTDVRNKAFELIVLLELQIKKIEQEDLISRIKNWLEGLCANGKSARNKTHRRCK